MQVALDGEVVYGEALVSTEHITGEALPVRRRLGDEVPAGALNHDGLLVVRASRPSSESMPARIANLTKDAQVYIPTSNSTAVGSHRHINTLPVRCCWLESMSLHRQDVELPVS